MSSRSHAHGHGRGSRNTLLFALGFTVIFALVEAGAGWWSNSLALIGDAGHMITDSLALGLGAVAAWVSLKPPSPRHSYGLKRAEVVGALLNTVFMFGVVAYIAVEAVRRLTSPEPVDGVVVMVVAAMGLLVNLAVMRVLHSGEQSLNVKGAMLHVMGDLLGSLAALIAGAVIWLTGWYPIDPLLSALIGLLILVSSLRLLREVLHVVMEGVPADVDLEELGQSMAAVSGVRHVHDLHVWALDSATYAVSAHAVVNNMADWEHCRRELEAVLADNFGITHATIQPEDKNAFETRCADDGCGPIFTGKA